RRAQQLDLGRLARAVGALEGYEERQGRECYPRQLVDVGGRKNSEAPLGLLPRAAGDEVVLRDQLVLQAPDVGVLWRDLLRQQGGLHPANGLQYLVERLLDAGVWPL